MNLTSTRRGFALRFGSVLSALGLTAATGVTRAMAESPQDSNAIRKLNGEGQPSQIDPITELASTDIGAVLKGDADSNAQAEDVMAINEVRNLLFNEVVPGQGFGQDLIALDIERGRDHGIGSYNQVREALGLQPVTSFAQITSNVTVQQELQEAYGNVNNIDAFEGGLAENLAPGSSVGTLFQTIMVDKFTALRNGDRFFYLNETWTPQELAIFQQGDTLTKVIEGNTDITNLQPNVFKFTASISGTVTSTSAAASIPRSSPPGLTHSSMSNGSSARPASPIVS